MLCRRIGTYYSEFLNVYKEREPKSPISQHWFWLNVLRTPDHFTRTSKFLIYFSSKCATEVAMLKGDGAGGGGADDYSCILVEQESFARSSAEYRYLLINIPSYLSAVIHPATFFCM